MSTSSTDTYDQVGIREDLTNAIYNVDPVEVPFVSMAPKVSASSTLHEWQTDSYASAADNKAVEGADASFSPAASTTRLTNRCQIAEKTAMISGTLEATNRAGRDREMTYQLIKRGVELKRDMETTLVGTNKAKVTGNATTEAELASMLSWIATNDDLAGTGASPTGDGTDTRTDGTQRAFTEAMLENTIDLIWNSGGNPDTVLVGSFNKRAMNAFLGRATVTEHYAKEKSIISAMDVYVSDYGTLKIVPDRFSRARDCLVIQKNMWAIAYLRNMKTLDIARTGDAEKKQLIVEYTLEARNEKSSGGVFDLTTS